MKCERGQERVRREREGEIEKGMKRERGQERMRNINETRERDRERELGGESLSSNLNLGIV